MFSISAISSSDSLLPGGDVADDDRHAEQAGLLRGAPAALAGDDLKPVADLAHDDRLDDAVRLDRLRQLLEPRIVDLAARLKVVRRSRSMSTSTGDGARFGRVGNQRAETFAESGTFFHGHTYASSMRRCRV